MSTYDPLEVVKANAGAILRSMSCIANTGFRLRLISIAMSQNRIGLKDAAGYVDQLINNVHTYVRLDNADEALDRVIDRALSFVALIDLAGSVKTDESRYLIEPRAFSLQGHVVVAILELFHMRENMAWLDEYTPNIGLTTGKYYDPNDIDG